MWAGPPLPARSFSTWPHLLCRGATACTSLREAYDAPMFERLPVMDDAGTAYAVDVVATHNLYALILTYFAMRAAVRWAWSAWLARSDDDDDDDAST